MSMRGNHAAGWWHHAVAALAIAYCGGAAMCGTLGIEHAVGAALAIGLAYAGPRSRTLLATLLPFALVGLVYDSMRWYGVSLRGTVHIADLYRLERAMFGIHTAAGTITPNEWFATHHAASADILCAAAYLLYIAVPAAFLIRLWWRGDTVRARWFGWSFLAVNLLGYAVYFLYPAAPPWYHAQYGDVLVANAPADAAGLLRVDTLLGVHFFATLYSRNPNVFGAMPSLHVAYALLTWLYARRAYPWWSLGAAVYVCVLNVAAVYLQHHYVLDLVAGNACAVLVYACGKLCMPQSVAEPVDNMPPMPPGMRRATAAGALVFVLTITVVVALWSQGILATDRLVSFAAQHPIAAPMLFIAVFAGCVWCFIPTTAHTIAAGAIWGPWLGLPLVMLAAAAGSLGAFSVARHIVAPRIAHRLASPAWTGFMAFTARRGWLAVACARILPVFPFALLNYVFGVTRIGLGEYLWSSFVFGLPSTAFYVSLGYLIHVAARGAEMKALGIALAIAAGSFACTVAVRCLLRHMSRDFALLQDTGRRQA